MFPPLWSRRLAAGAASRLSLGWKESRAAATPAANEGARACALLPSGEAASWGLSPWTVREARARRWSLMSAMKSRELRYPTRSSTWLLDKDRSLDSSFRVMPALGSVGSRGHRCTYVACSQGEWQCGMRGEWRKLVTRLMGSQFGSGGGSQGLVGRCCDICLLPYQHAVPWLAESALYSWCRGRLVPGACRRAMLQAHSSRVR
jgi:hypothetical protein